MINADAKIILRQPAKWSERKRNDIADWMEAKASELRREECVKDYADGVALVYNPDDPEGEV